MKLHEREIVVRRADVGLRTAIEDVIDKHDLTAVEALQVVNAALSSWIGSYAKYAIRRERHGNEDTPGGWAAEPSSSDSGESK